MKTACTAILAAEMAATASMAESWRVCLRAQGGYTVDITWMQGKIIDYKVTGGDPKGYRTVLSAK